MGTREFLNGSFVRDWCRLAFSVLERRDGEFRSRCMGVGSCCMGDDFIGLFLEVKVLGVMWWLLCME